MDHNSRDTSVGPIKVVFPYPSCMKLLCIVSPLSKTQSSI